MINGEKYKTADERNAALDKFCKRHGRYCLSCPICHYDGEDSECDMFKWLELEADEDNPMNCPFCGGETQVVRVFGGAYSIHCLGKGCGYASGQEANQTETIAAHNRVCKAVATYKKSNKKSKV